MMHPLQTTVRSPRLAWFWAPVCVVVLLSACQGSGPGVGPQLPPPDTEKVSLYCEVVSFQFADGKMVGQGFYYFHNPHPTEQAIPVAMQFFVSGWQSAPENVEMTHVLPEEDLQLPYVWIDGSLPFTQIVIPPTERYCLRIDWEQTLSENRFAYLLKREQPWDGRRSLLRLTIQLPAEARDVRMSLDPSYRFKSEIHRGLVIVKEDFRPESNLAVEWEE